MDSLPSDPCLPAWTPLASPPTLPCLSLPPRPDSGGPQTLPYLQSLGQHLPSAVGREERQEKMVSPEAGEGRYLLTTQPPQWPRRLRKHHAPFHSCYSQHYVGGDPGSYHFCQLLPESKAVRRQLGFLMCQERSQCCPGLLHWGRTGSATTYSWAQSIRLRAWREGPGRSQAPQCADGN